MNSEPITDCGRTSEHLAGELDRIAQNVLKLTMPDRYYLFEAADMLRKIDDRAKSLSIHDLNELDGRKSDNLTTEQRAEVE